MTRSFAKVDRFAIFQIGRNNGLSGFERWCLITIVLQADFRTHQWAGTLGFLADEMGVTRRTAKTAVDGLAAKQQLAVLEPFGPNSQGRVRVNPYGLLVVPARKRTEPIGADGDDMTRAAVAPDSRPIRAVSEPIGANGHGVTSEDASARGIEASGEEGIADEHAEAKLVAAFAATEVSAHRCGRCGLLNFECGCPF